MGLLGYAGIALITVAVIRLLRAIIVAHRKDDIRE